MTAKTLPKYFPVDGVILCEPCNRIERKPHSALCLEVLLPGVAIEIIPRNSLTTQGFTLNKRAAQFVSTCHKSALRTPEIAYPNRSHYFSKGHWFGQITKLPDNSEEPVTEVYITIWLPLNSATLVR